MKEKMIENKEKQKWDMLQRTNNRAVVITGEFLISIIGLITPFGYEIKDVLSPYATGFEFEFGKAVPAVLAKVMKIKVR